MAHILRIFRKIVVHLQCITSATVNQIVHSYQTFLNNLFIEYCRKSKSISTGNETINKCILKRLFSKDGVTPIKGGLMESS